MKKIGKMNVAVFASLLLMASLVAMANPLSALDTTTPISLATISQHNSSTDCWTALNGKVYNLTSYINQHPGGSAMSVICGIDGTQIMSGQHPSSYEALVSTLQIGILEELDTTPPAITILGSNPINVTQGSVYIDAGATASDNVDGNLTSEIVVVNGVNTSVAGSYNVTYSVTDSSNNSAQAIRIVLVSEAISDITSPIITILGANPFSLNVGETYTDAGATASDNVDGNLTSEIVVVNGVNTSIAGNYTVTYSVKDASNNSASATRNVIVLVASQEEEHEDDDHHEEDKKDKHHEKHKDKKRDKKHDEEHDDRDED